MDVEDVQDSYRHFHAKDIVECQACGKAEDILNDEQFPLCGRCHVVAYCSRECQQRDWRRHKRNCAPNQEDPADRRLRRQLRRFLDKIQPLILMVGQCEFAKLKLRHGPNANLGRFTVVLNLSEGQPFQIESITMEPTTNERPESMPGSTWRSLMVRSGGTSSMGVGEFFEETFSLPPSEEEAERFDVIKERHCRLINDMSSKRRQDLLAAARRGRDEGRSLAGREALEEEEAFLAWMNEQGEH